VYLKNMLLSEKADNLLPDWGFFVKCVINATDLRPTASRESFYEDEQLSTARQTLGRCLRDYLLRMAREEPDRLDQLIAIHYLAMKALAVEDDEFFTLFIDLLPFETSLGEMPLGEYLQKQKSVQYVPTRDQFRQIAGVAAAQSLCVINGGYVYDADLLEKLSTLKGRDVERLNVADLSESFESLTLDERDKVFDFVKLADRVLQPYRTSVEIKKFEPRQLPALYTTNDAANFLRSVEQSKEVADELWSGVLDGIAEEPSVMAYSQLCLNYKNPLVRKIAQLKHRALVQRSLEMLYVQALLLGHYPLKSKEMKLLNEGLLGLIELGVDAQQAKDE
jgi:molecular chaperone HtpG